MCLNKMHFGIYPYSEILFLLTSGGFTCCLFFCDCKVWSSTVTSLLDGTSWKLSTTGGRKTPLFSMMLSCSLTFHLRSVHTKVCIFDSFLTKNQACLVFVLIIQLKEFPDRPCQRSVPTVIHLTLHCDFSMKVQIDSFPLWNHFGIMWQMNP